MADPTIIDAGTRIDGRISGDADVTVRGRVDGEIELSEALVVDPDGLVRGSIRVREARIEGAVEGDINASERIFLGASARVVGSLEAEAIVIADGAQFAGEVTMDLGAEVPVSGTTSSATRRTSPARATRSARPESRPARTERPAPAVATASASPAGAAQAAAQAPPAATTTTTVVEEPEPEPEAPEADQAPEEVEATEQTEAEASQPDYQEMTVKELREELRDLDLQVSGTKDELIERLQHAAGD